MFGTPSLIVDLEFRFFPFLLNTGILVLKLSHHDIY